MVVVDYVENSKEQTIDKIVQGRPQSVVFNLEKARYLSATDISYFISIYKTVKSYGGNIEFINANPRHKKLFFLCRLDDVFKIEGVKAYAGG